MIDREEPKRAEEEFGKLLDVFPQYLAVSAADGKRLFANDTFLEFLGMTLQEFQADDFRRRAYHPDDLERVESILPQSLANGEPWEMEARIRSKDGQYRWLLIRVRPVRDDQGKITRWYFAGTDIQDRKQSERELQQLVDTIPHQVVVLDAEGRRVYFNRVVLDFLGWTPEEVMRPDASRAFHPDDWAGFQEARRAFSKGLPFETEARLRRKDGQYRWFLFLYYPYRNEQGQIVRWYGTGTDIEDRKQAERELQQLVDTVPQHIVVLDAEGKPLHANRVVLDFLGWTLDKFMRDACETFHPDDRVDFRQACRAFSQGQPFEIEARLRRKDGQYRWFLFRYSPYRNVQGQIVRWYSAGFDIEDRKQAEQELQQLVDAVPHRIVVAAADGARLYANKVVLDYHGCTLEEFLDERSLSRRLHPDDIADYLNTRQKGIAGGLPFQTEIRLHSKSGEYRWFLVQFNPWRNEHGRAVRWYAAGTDIDDRKAAERALEREKNRLGLMLEFTNKLVTKLDLRELLRTVATSVRRVIPCDLVSIFLPDSKPNLLRNFVVDFPASKGFIMEESQDPSSKHSVAIDKTLVGRVFRTGSAWAGTDSDLLQLGLKHDPGIAEGLKTISVLPVVCCDKVLAVLALARCERKLFDNDELDLLHQIAGQVAIAIFNALITDDRKRAEDALRRSEAYLEEAQQLSHTGSFAHDVARNEIVYWSAESYRNFGFDPANGPIPWKDARTRIHPDDRVKIEECQQKAIQQKSRTTVDFRVLLADGSVRHIHSQCRPVLNAANEVVELVGTNIDVTEQYTARLTLERALEENKRLKDELYRENLALKEEIDQSSMFEEIVGTSDALRRVLVHVAKVAPTDSTILISGETGTGKELIARAIHKRSQRSSRPFVSVNCAAIPQALIGSELFGHEKGAFTGATERRLGRFELADGGTLFLDEVGDLPSETQIALLRVLQERQFERIGGSQAIAVNVRVIAATNRDLKEAVTAGAFRSDLFYRLNVFPIGVPPLRDRKADLPLLVEYLIDRYANKMGKKFKNIQKRTMESFQAYNWPGNIRELQNVIERAVILCDGETFMLDESWLQSEPTKASHGGDGLARLGPSEERKLIEKALTESRGRVSGPAGAAARLSIPRSTLETKIRKLGIKKHRFNPD